jgi:hypothetical protein
MNGDVFRATVEALSPLVGRAMAVVYVSQAALDRGKASDDLEPEDLGWLREYVAHEMSAFATRDVVDDAFEWVRRRVL